MKSILTDIITPALLLLPPRMTSDKAMAEMLAIQAQEDPDQRRRQWRAGVQPQPATAAGAGTER